MQLPTPKDHAETVALFRSLVIGALTRSELERGDLRAELERLSQQRFRPPGFDHNRSYSVPTLERWYYAYRAGGLEALRPKLRSDRGRAQDLTPEQRDLLCDVRREHPSASAELILRTLVADGRVPEGAVSPATVRRLFAENGLDRVTLRQSHTEIRLRWQAARPGILWHADVCHGPSLRIDGNTRPLRIHALLDDASRFILAIEAHHTECESEMLGLFVRALRLHPAPEVLYLDNGSTYRGDVLRLACERLGVTLVHAKPHDPQARGKMERFWRTLRQRCLDYLGALTSLHEVNIRLRAFLDHDYHVAPHGALLGRSPGGVWSELPPPPFEDRLTEQHLRAALTVRERRRVRRDSTLSIDGQAFEIDQGFFAGRIVSILRCWLDPTEAPVVEHEGKQYPLRPVDPVRNAHRPRPKREDDVPPTPKTPFDPNAARLGRDNDKEDSE